MSYPEAGYGDDSRLRGEPGFRDDPDFRDSASSTGSFTTGSYPTARFGDPAEVTPTRPVSAAELDGVFDDPAHGQPGMDRLGVHVLLEALLLGGVVVLAYFFHRWHGSQIAGDALRSLLVSTASLGLICTGLALSLRAGVVNLAVGPIAMAAAVFFAEHADRGVIATAGVTALLAAAAGAAMGLAIVVFHVPAWAVSLAGGLGAVVWLQKHPHPVTLTGYDPAKHAIYWYALFAAVSVAGGLLGLFKSVRRGVSRFRPVGDPAHRRGGVAAVVAFLAMTGSAVLAGIGGSLDAMASRTVSGTGTDGGVLLTTLALGAVLVGGTSVFGRRGGIFGTLLAATLLVLFLNYGVAADWKMSPYAVAAGAIGVGLVVSRLVEMLGQPRSGGPGGSDTWGGVGGDESGPSWGGGQRQSAWGSQLPARSIDDTWGGSADDRWGAR
jgi:ribose/xylose/arabinose/galactoside ABC-type transport system permease subunit